MREQKRPVTPLYPEGLLSISQNLAEFKHLTEILLHLFTRKSVQFDQRQRHGYPCSQFETRSLGRIWKPLEETQFFSETRDGFEIGRTFDKMNT